jgi:hypothetical protein
MPQEDAHDATRTRTPFLSDNRSGLEIHANVLYRSPLSPR